MDRLLHQERILRSLPELKASGMFSDAMLHVDMDKGGKFASSFCCHRFLLSAAGNSCFREIIGDDHGEVVHVFLPDFNQEEVNDVLNLIYCISTNKPDKNSFFEEFFTIQDFIQIKKQAEIKYELLELPSDPLELSEKDELREDKAKKKQRKKMMKPGVKEFLWSCQKCPRGILRPFHTWLMHTCHSKDGHFKMGMNLCECCGLDCNDIDYLLLHNLNVPCLRNTKMEKSVKCQICPFKSFSLRSLQNHVFMQHGNRCQAKVPQRSDYYSCEICHSIIHTIQGFSKHQRTIHGITPENFQAYYEETHLKYWNRFDPIFLEINSLGPSKDARVKTKQWIYCEPCQKGYLDKAGFRFHMKSHQQFPCKFCSENILTVHEYHDHRRRCSGPLMCSVNKCRETFKTRNEILKHLEQCHMTRPFLKQHEKVHVNGKTMFKCDLCDSLFAKNTGVQRHKVSVHTDKSLPKKYNCDFENCNYSTNVDTNFISHKKIHNGHNFSCHICGHGTTEKYNLKVHMETKHPDGNITILCSVCGKVFNNQFSLRRHSVSHKSTHRCDVCGKTFNWESSLRSHKTFAHTSEKNFICQYPGCTKAFKIKYHLQRHQREKCHDIKLNMEIAMEEQEV